MDIYKRVLRLLRRRRATASESLVFDDYLDNEIRHALLDEALAQPPADTWERLRKAIVESKPVRGYGMWILDEPLRDPPEAHSRLFGVREYERIMRLYLDSRRYSQARPFKEAMWSNVPPSFTALVNL